MALGALLIPFGFLTDFGWDVVAAQRQGVHAISWETQFEDLSVKPGEQVTDAESLLREVHRLLSMGQRAQALGLAQDLVARYPHFQLGQLLFADLLSMTSGQTVDARVVSDFALPTLARKLKQLNDQAQLRLARPDSQVYKGKEPAGLAFLSPKVPFVILVDALHSRLYVMAHNAQANGLKVIFESYMSVGQRGVGKQQKGDGKTPLGLYFIQRAYPGHALPDLYGAGALTLNYPNDLDVLDGKTGSGIWLHGSPSEEFSRAPEASDGCVVLTNPDMAFLMRLQLPVGTPVFIQRQIDWVEPQKNQDLRTQLSPALQDGGGASGDVLALFKWQADGRKMMATITSPENKALAQAASLKSDYWIEQARQWRAVSTPSEDVSKVDRSSGGVRSTKRRSGIEVSQLQMPR
jgi:L,D-transpeptidase catalytic domain